MNLDDQTLLHQLDTQYLALAYQTDPAPVAALEQLKDLLGDA